MGNSAQHPEPEEVMIDVSTKQPLRVSNEGTAGPYVMVPLDQLDELRQLLDAKRIGYWVDENAISLNGAAYIAVVNFGRNADPNTIQSILDAVN
jgi:hypothetical protein